jgi:glycosyltransferase involved in cell wall biosynthesis
MSSAPASLLFITTQLPYPPKSGGTVKSWNYVKDLSRRYKLGVATLLKDDDVEFVEEFKKQLPINELIAEEHQIGRSIITLLKSYLGFPCLNVFRNYNQRFEQAIHAVMNQYSVIIIDHYEMFQYVSDDCSAKIVLHTHNAEFMLWKRLSELEKNPLKRFLLKLESKRVAHYEQRIFRSADLIFTTESDEELYHKNGFVLGQVATTYHLGNDQLLELPALSFSNTELAITFMGTLSWEPNIDGLVWFLKEVWPILKDRFPTLKFYILGKDPDQRIKVLAQDDTQVIFTGFVKELDEYLKKSRVYIAPLRFGSGMKVKVLEGLYRGVPTVSTSIGAEGLKVEDGKHIMIADEPKDFAEKCIRLLNDETLWKTLMYESRMLASNHYRWKPLFERMDLALRRLF